IDILISLLKSNYKLVAARTGIQGLKLAKKNMPDLILLDIVMPEMDGYEVCKQLKSNDATKNIPIIFITALSEAMDEAKGFRLGAVDYITKPFTPVTVKARVKTHINLKVRTDMLEELASIDGLTGINNRRRFDEMLEKEWNRGIRDQSFLSLVIADIDYFKRYNDNYGHASGDECLRIVADCLNRSIVRSADTLCRYGGEEFGIILPGTDIQGGLEVAQKLRDNIFLLNIPHEFSKISDRITISLGVASLKPEKHMYHPNDLLEAADQMLYQSKNNGRNQISGSEFKKHNR
ncbi:MAG: diguanylate cyclase, partial [Desulfobacteraceae bacterium]|nr:diguanylate cyclase [Desulfobacteraceae bacterium]